MKKLFLALTLLFALSFSANSFAQTGIDGEIPECEEGWYEHTYTKFVPGHWGTISVPFLSTTIDVPYYFEPTHIQVTEMAWQEC